MKPFHVSLFAISSAMVLQSFSICANAGALFLDGVDDWVSFSSPNGDIPTGDSPFTIECWINPSGPVSGGGGGQMTFWGEQAGNQANGFRMAGPEGVVHYFWGNDHGETFLDGSILEDDTGPGSDGWHHVALTFDGSETVWYHNGDPLGNPRSVFGMNVADNNYRIGSRIDAEFFDGYIDELRIWSTARTEAEVLNNFDAGVSGSSPNLVAYWDFENDLEDVTGNGHDGTHESDGIVEPGVNAPVSSGCDPEVDVDGDGLQDECFEELYFDGLDQPANGDPDEDGLDNIGEQAAGTNPTVPDSDGDGLNDGDEIIAETNPRNPDSDGDDLPDGVETNTGIFVSNEDTGSDPNNPNTDGDSFSDGVEIARGTNPVDPNDPPAPGAGEGALSLDGTAWVAFNNDSGLIPDEDEPFTVEAWINPAGPTAGDQGGQMLFWGNQAGSQSNGFRMRGPNGVRHYFWGNDHDEDFVDGSIIPDESGPFEDGWHHLALTYDGSETNWYHNGEPLGSPRAVSGLAVADANHRIGSRLNAEFFDGFMDEIGIWNVARTAEEILGDRDVCLDPTAEGLVAYWNFDGGSFEDLTGNGHDGEAMGDGAVIVGNESAPCSGGGSSTFQIEDLAFDMTAREVTITWFSRANRSYAVEFSSDLVNWTELDDGIESAGDTTSYDDIGIPLDAVERYYRVILQAQ